MGEYKFSTYRDACARIDAIGRALLSIRAKAKHKILIFSETRPEWLLTAFAAFHHNITVVTLLPTLDAEGVCHGIDESEVNIIFTSQELIADKLEVRQCISLLTKQYGSSLRNVENIGSNRQSSLHHLLSSTCRSQDCQSTGG